MWQAELVTLSSAPSKASVIACCTARDQSELLSPRLGCEHRGQAGWARN